MIKKKNKLFMITKDKSIREILDVDVWNFFDEAVEYMDDYDQFRKVCAILLNHYSAYDIDIWALYQAMFNPYDTITLDLLADKLADLFYSLLNNKRIDVCEYAD